MACENGVEVLPAPRLVPPLLGVRVPKASLQVPGFDVE